MEWLGQDQVGLHNFVCDRFFFCEENGEFALCLLFPCIWWSYNSTCMPGPWHLKTTPTSAEQPKKVTPVKKHRFAVSKKSVVKDVRVSSAGPQVTEVHLEQCGPGGGFIVAYLKLKKRGPDETGLNRAFSSPFLISLAMILWANSKSLTYGLQVFIVACPARRISRR